MISLSRDTELRTRILSAIDKVDDASHRTILLLMLQILDEIGSKIDAVLGDEAAIKQMVLNGYVEAHNSHHAYIARMIARDETVEIAARTTVVEWATRMVIGLILLGTGTLVGMIISQYHG